MGAVVPQRLPLPTWAPARTTTPKNPPRPPGRGPGVKKGYRAAALNRRTAAPRLRGRGEGNRVGRAARSAEPRSSRRRYDASMGRPGLTGRALSWQPWHPLASFPPHPTPADRPPSLPPLRSLFLRFGDVLECLINLLRRHLACRCGEGGRRSAALRARYGTPRGSRGAEGRGSALGTPPPSRRLRGRWWQLVAVGGRCGVMAWPTRWAMTGGKLSLALLPRQPGGGMSPGRGPAGGWLPPRRWTVPRSGELERYLCCRSPLPRPLQGQEKLFRK